ncbi:MAG: restriction endonuclease [Sulfurovum sp.]|nr:restriction endonuclease [Sulfurovum sp.]
MGVLHHLGLRGEHKNVFEDSSLLDAISILQSYNTVEHRKIAYYLQYFLNAETSHIGVQKYLNEVIEALKYLGGEASLSDIYEYIDDNYNFKIPQDSLHSSIRKSIYQNSSDADLYQRKQDLFYAVDEKGKGLWGLRSFMPTSEHIELTEDDDGFPEGKQKLRIHLQRERNPKLIREVKKRFKAKYGRLFCQVCSFDFYVKYGEIGDDFIEGHHTKPVSEFNDSTFSKIEDIALLCSNCHKMVHRKRPWLSIDDLKEILS